jgi:hypothetical protein
MRSFASRVTLESSSGDVIRHLPRAQAEAMIDAGRATIANVNGKVHSIRLIASAGTHARRIGKPEGASMFGTKFVFREKLDSGGVTWKHHPRATYEEPE